MQTSTRSLVTLFTIFCISCLSSAENIIASHSLNPCMDNSAFSAKLFTAIVTPANLSASLQIDGFSNLGGYIVANVEVIAYGFSIINKTIDPCESEELEGFCNMPKGGFQLKKGNFNLPADALSQVPGVAYAVPDLDGLVRLRVFQRDDATHGPTGPMLACLEADLSNTKSIYQKAVGWVTAIIAGSGLIASGVTSGLGHTNTAAHVAANAVSLFGVFQAQAIIGMTSVAMPPIVQSWTQNFQWSMGIIRVGFLQTMATWYQRATGGTPTTYLSTLNYVSVEVQKRAVKRAIGLVTRAVQSALAPRAYHQLAKRESETITNLKVVRGIERVGFRAGIEQTNIFMTGLIFFLAILIFTALFVGAAKAGLEALVKSETVKSDKFLEFRNGWRVVIKGILFRLVLLGYVQMSILCLWQLTERDSAGEIVLAIFIFLAITACLAWACFKVIMLAKRSLLMHKNPGYMLYSDPACLNKWGFLYVSYKATSYYFVVILLGYILLKAIFIAFAQSAPAVQAIGLLIIEAGYLVAVSVLKPWMDKKTNAFNISIAAVNFTNAIFLLMFSEVFGQPAQVSGIMGVIFALYNVIFMTVLLIMVLISSVYAVTSKNPETRYQPMRDDRGSFIKSQAALTTELDALGATARGDPKDVPREHYRKEVDDLSSSNDSLGKPPVGGRPMSQRHSNSMYPSEQPEKQQMYQQVTNESQLSSLSRPSTNASPYVSPTHSFQGPPSRPMHSGYGPPQLRNQNPGRSSPWQRGAGYD